MKMKVWCVKHRDGWCAVRNNSKPHEGVSSVPTKCNMFVILPLGIQRRMPTCFDCKKVLNENRIIVK